MVRGVAEPDYIGCARYGGLRGLNMLFEGDTEALPVRRWLVVRKWVVCGVAVLLAAPCS